MTYQVNGQNAVKVVPVCVGKKQWVAMLENKFGDRRELSGLVWAARHQAKSEAFSWSRVIA